MTLTQIQKDIIINAQAKALGSLSPDNTMSVIPVSTVRIIEDDIILCNYYMHTTHENILSNPDVVLTCWSDSTGLELKGNVSYQDSGDLFEKMKSEIHSIDPEKTLNGVLIIKPLEVIDVSLPAK